MKVILTPTEGGIHLSFQVQDGKTVRDVRLPLSKEEIETYYRYNGFQQYVAWEELFDAGVLVDSVLPYDHYYELLRDEQGRETLRTLSLPIEETEVDGQLLLQSLPQEGQLALRLFDKSGRNLDRIGRPIGAFYHVKDELYLLPEKVYHLKKALSQSYESGYQKVGICQQLAKEAGIQLEHFLENETYHVVDQYDLDIKVHSHDHIELVPVGRNELETMSRLLIIQN
ncbi:hypothetical protein [Anoxybacillus flavithermus]|uniref:hypothetical protein n=1 Tax=Anoxybacillus flavithermus TaxID=33934 RepID=UPI001867B833|nr:hypothetical protein [Anoxybacillus flavithermus]MBE2911655.1 hypothetical protein [Anoxybacillus flavithermus]MBE2917112.1 hypothetical protein [Anoxybacillus flavithermus]